MLRDGRTAFPAMFEAIANAKKEVLVEMYWFAADEAGTKVRDALIAAAKRGLTVRVIYDGFGSLNVPDRFWAPLREEKTARVRVYGPVKPWRRQFNISRILHRDHRKLIVVDGNALIVGGMNIGDEWWSPDGAPTWRDDALELHGKTAQEVRTLFWHTWQKMGGRIPPGIPARSEESNGLVWLIANDWRIASRRTIRRTYLQQIRKARRSIDIANAYFLPDPGVLRAIIAARRRGVPVRLLLPSKNDVPHLGLAQEALVPKLLNRGIQVFAYAPDAFHSKTAVIDDFVTIGSYNLDHRSWLLNLECNIAVFDPAFAKVVRESFDEDLTVARAVGPDGLGPGDGFLRWLFAQLFYRLRYFL